MEPINIYMVTKWSLFIKKITVAYQVTEQNYSLKIFHQLNITLEFPAEADHWAVYVQMWMGVFVT